MIFTISQIKEIESQIEEDSLIAFDLDNTLLTSNTYFGSIRWENSLISDFEKEGVSYEEAHERACLIWNRAQPEIKLKLIEEESPDFIKRWKKTSCVIGLTARSLNLKDLTHEGLKSNKISFTPFLNHKLDILHKGVLYCSYMPKSKALKKFIDEVLAKKPKKIVVVDDKKENLRDILNSRINKHFDIRCYYYSNDPYKNFLKT